MADENKIMTKQEEIWDGVTELMRESVGGSWHTYETDRILTYLHSQGVVIKVERELPPSCLIIPKKADDFFLEGATSEVITIDLPTVKAMKLLGYVAVEPLIEDNPNSKLPE